MSNIAKLKKKAAEFELKKQPDKALNVYIELLSAYESSPEELDVSLFNRVGDLLLKQGNVADAVDYYERAVDHYSEGGFFNNAIALCNKILRQSPGRTTVYYKLGKISAQKGFTAEAKRNFLEFADRMQKSGRMDDAFRALKEFADLCPDQDDIRLMLADQLQKAGKPQEAVEQLQLLYQRYSAENRHAEAEATAERIRSIDPDAEVSAGNAQLETKAQDLVFLDLSEAPKPTPTAPRGVATTPPIEEKPPEIEPTTLPGTATPDQTDAVPLDGMTKPVDAGAVEGTPVEGLETTSLDMGEAAVEESGALDELEPTALAEPGSDNDEGEAAGTQRSGAEDTPGEGGIASLDEEQPEEDRRTPDESGPTTDGLPMMEVDGEPGGGAAPRRSGPLGREATMLAAKSVEILQAVVDGRPEDWDAHRELGEAMLDAGNRDGGLREFETAMKGYETEGKIEAAASMADEIVRTDPTSVKHYQKRVEYAYRTRDQRRLVDAYLELADALFRTDQPGKARVIYHRVLELAPDNARAQDALSALPETPPQGVPDAGRTIGDGPSDASPIPTPSSSDFVNLGDLMRDEQPRKDTRMVVAEQEPSGNEEADFADMLRKFKHGVEQNVDEEDYQSHYDLGIAYKEMGLLDEAISEFQKALRASDSRVRTYEAIGLCFMEKSQYQMASTLLSRALHEKGVADDKLVGVLYLLGRAAEELGNPDDALTFYQRVFVIDVQFRDVGQRMDALERAAR